MTAFGHFALCVCVAGCAVRAPSPTAADTTAPRPGDITAAQAGKDAITLGKSTKADVMAALVILFAPSGVVTKTRILLP